MIHKILFKSLRIVLVLDADGVLNISLKLEVATFKQEESSAGVGPIKGK